MSLLSFIDHAYYDVAIIEMDTAVEFSNFVYPICIPEIPKEIDNRVNTGATWLDGVQLKNQMEQLVLS